LAVIEVRWGDPFGFAVFAFAGSPAAGLDEGVVGSAGEGEFVDVGAMGGGPVLNVVNFAPVSANGAAWPRTPAILGMKSEIVHAMMAA
jgi:hypothetical protein